ncbi:hypothetical protein B484DRAFT_442369 [Ochromonadaceae sp. CCMP2298]|nr:hypothetical protein B484DRAFT_442369 [Ochromonadaceae sp. CCMP2298]
MERAARSWCVALLLLLAAWVPQTHQSDPAYPAPHTAANRILSMVLAYNLNRIDPLTITLNEYKSMCEAGWEVEVVFLTYTHPSELLQAYFKSKMYCYRTQSHVTLRWAVFTQGAEEFSGYHLANEQRAIVAREIEQHDFFIYHEEDMMLQHAHIAAYLHETQALDALLGSIEAARYMFGFQRYRRHTRKLEDNTKHISEHDIMSQDHLDELPFFKPVCLAPGNSTKESPKAKPYLRIESYKAPLGNPHQAIWMMTRAQVWHLEEKCNFFNQTLRGTTHDAYTREFMSSLSIFENHIIPKNCGLIKLLPAERMPSFAILHFYTRSNPSNPKSEDYPVFGSSEHIQAGMMQVGTGRIQAGYFDDLECWQPVVQRSRERQMQWMQAAAEDSRRRCDEATSSSSSSSSSSRETECAAATEAAAALVQPFDTPKVLEGKTIYVLENGRRHTIPSREVFEAHHFDWEAVLKPHQLTGYAALPMGEDYK